MESLAEMYEKGLGVKLDMKKKAERLYRRPQIGIALAFAQSNLGAVLHSEKKFDEAFPYFALAADQGYTGAESNLGVCYRDGDGTEVDVDKADTGRFEHAAAKGYAKERESAARLDAQARPKPSYAASSPEPESRYLSETQRRSLKVVVGATAIGAVGGAGVGAAAGAVLGAGAAGVMAVRANVAGTTKMRESHLWKTVREYLDARGFGAALRLEWGQMRLLVFGSRATVADVTVEREVVSRVGGYVNVDVSGGWLGNKGGLAARLLVEPRAPATPRRNGSFSSLGCSGLREGRTDALDAHLGAVFDRARDHAAAGGAAPTVALGLLSVHLPAHEGRAEDRADAFRRIMDDCGEALAGADAQLLLGDFNARLGGGRSREVVLDAVNRAVAGDGAALALLYRRDDELVAALARAAYARDDALRGLATPDCDFAPTFKVARGLRGCAYSPKRLPSWTDRVLYRASQRAPGVRCDLDVERYAACPDVSSSDHKPVVLVATVRLAAGS
ncbi:hypothetical protein SO694_00007650 [Aureococcus anophagefferens]|uniref:Inositol polyphosphate-related phosphatase domain-containing protein n=1 Tax=Aureococcus anophagefferens TaxID=44056 RepID=A0ABR1GB63_AURAN